MGTDADYCLPLLKWQPPDSAPVNALYLIDFAGGSGIAGDPYLIDDAKQLARLATLTNTGEVDWSGDMFAARNYTLRQDITFDGTELWEPIGNTTDPTDPTERIFNGTFDGGGKTISNMNVSVTRSGTNEGAYAGLFGYVENATIRNVHLENASVNATSSNRAAYAGGSGGVCLRQQHHHELLRDRCGKGRLHPLHRLGWRSGGTGRGQLRHRHHHELRRAESVGCAAAAVAGLLAGLFVAGILLRRRK